MTTAVSSSHIDFVRSGSMSVLMTDWSGQSRGHRVFVLAFEPLLDKYSRQLARFSTPLAYHKNAVPLGHFDSQGIILPFTISSEEGNATFHVQALDGCSSLLKFGERKLAGYGRHVTTTCKDAVETRTVPTISLKTVLERWLPPHLRATRLKVDAQGMDMAIVNTAGPRLADFDIVKMESYPSDCEPMYEGMPPVHRNREKHAL